MKTLKKIGKWFFLVSCLFLVGGLTATYLLKDKIIKALEDALNENLNRSLVVGKTDFSIFRKFPHATIYCDQVFMGSGDFFNQAGEDTLFAVDRIYFLFDLRSIFSDEYVLKEIEFVGGQAQLQINNHGLTNYRFWKPPAADSEGSGDVNLHIEKFNLQDFDLVYKDFRDSTFLDLYAESLTTSFKLNGSNCEMGLHGNTFLNDLKVSGKDIASQLDVAPKFHFQFDTETYLFSITDGQVKLNNQQFILSGGGKNLLTLDGLNLDIQLDKTDIVEIRQMIQPFLPAIIDSLNPTGTLSASCKITEIDAAAGKDFIRLESDFELENGWVIWNKRPLKKLHLKGKYFQPNVSSLYKTSLTLESFSFMFKDSKVSGEMTIPTLKAPEIQLTTKLDARLENLHELLPPSTDDFSMKGQLLGDVAFNINPTPPDKQSPVKVLNSSFNLKDAELKGSTLPHQLSKITGELVLAGKDTKLDFQLSANEVPFSIKGKLTSLTSFILENKQLSGQLAVNSPSLDVDKILDINTPEGDASGDAPEPLIPINLKLKVHLLAQQFTYQKAHGKNLDAYLSVENGLVYLLPVNVETMGGAVKLNATFDGRNPRAQHFKGRLMSYGLDVNQVFEQMENFGQTTLRHDHLKGTLNADTRFQMDLDEQFNPIESSIEVITDLSIKDGELNNFEMFDELSGYINTDLVKNIQFSELKNTLRIADRKVSIPEMTIRSSAIDLNIRGEQTFNNDLDYHISTRFSQLWAMKVRKAKKENDDFGEKTSDGGLVLHFKVGCNVDDPCIKHDRKAMWQAVGDSWKNQGTELKEAFSTKNQGKEANQEKEKITFEVFIPDTTETDTPEDDDEDF